MRDGWSKTLRMTASRRRDNSQGAIGGGEDLARAALCDMWYGDGRWNRVETGREPGVQDGSRWRTNKRQDKREKDEVGSVAKRAMSWYILENTVLFALR